MAVLTGRVAHNSVALFFTRAAIAAASVVSVPVLYARLGERPYGVWALLTGLVGIAALADLGLGSAQIREVALAVGAAEKRHARGVLALGCVWAAVIGMFAMAATAACWPVLVQVFHLNGLAEQARGAALLLLLGFLADSLAMPWRAVLEGTQRYTPVGWITGGTALGGAGLAVLAALGGGGLVLIAATVTATSTVRALILVAVARRCVPALTPRLRDIRRSDLTDVAGYGLRVQVSSAAAAVNNETDRLVLGGFFQPQTVAAFDVGSRLANLLRLPPSLVLTALFPAAAVAATDTGSDRLDLLYVRATRYLAAFAAVGAAALVVSADPLVRLWLGHPVPLAATTIVVLTPGYAVNVVSGAVAVVTRAQGRPGTETRYAVLAAALNIVLTIPLLRLLGPWGVPLSTTVSASVSTVYFFVHFHRSSRRPLAPLVRALWRPAVAGVVAASVTWLAAAGLPDGVGRADAAYAVVCRSGLVVLIAALVLAALGFPTAAERARLWVIATHVVSRRDNRARSAEMSTRLEKIDRTRE
jgi:O-antigen/teichoic acid export membrane protein